MARSGRPAVNWSGRYQRFGPMLQRRLGVVSLYLKPAESWEPVREWLGKEVRPCPRPSSSNETIGKRPTRLLEAPPQAKERKNEARFQIEACRHDLAMCNLAIGSKDRPLDTTSNFRKVCSERL